MLCNLLSQDLRYKFTSDCLVCKHGGCHNVQIRMTCQFGVLVHTVKWLWTVGILLKVRTVVSLQQGWFVAVGSKPMGISIGVANGWEMLMLVWFFWLRK